MNSIVKNTNVSKLVSSICDGSYKEIELTEYVNLIQKISLSYLKYQEVIGKHIRWERNKNIGELEDLALDCVAGLFMRNEDGEFIQFKKYFLQNDRFRREMDDVETLVLLRRLVIKKTKQELSRIFKERDPEGAKIVRNIKVAIKSAKDFSSFREMGREYIYMSNGHDVLQLLSKSNGRDDNFTNGKTNGMMNGKSVTSNGTDLSAKGSGQQIRGDLSSNAGLRRAQPTIPEKSLRFEYLSSYSRKDPVSASIRKMLAVVQEDERYQNFLPLDMVARIMRHTNLEMARDRLSSQITEVSPLDDLKMQEIERRKIAVLIRIEKKIASQYVATNKLSKEKGLIYYKALADILEDICHGKKYDSYFKHLGRYIPELDQKAYRTQERTIFEYLGKLVKKWFKDSLLELL